MTTPTELSCLRSLVNTKQLLNEYIRRTVVNAAVIRSAPHAVGCPMSKRGAWHIPMVIDATTGNPRSAIESDCDCWKSAIVSCVDLDLPLGLVEAVGMAATAADKHGPGTQYCKNCGWIRRSAHLKYCEYYGNPEWITGPVDGSQRCQAVKDGQQCQKSIGHDGYHQECNDCW